MAKVFRPSTREATILNKIEHNREWARRRALQAINDRLDPLANAMAAKLVEHQLVETSSKDDLEDQIRSTLENLSRADDFDIDYKSAPFRHIVENPHVISLFMTAFVIETLINHRSVVDVFGTDEEIYHCIHRQVVKHLPD